MKTALLLLILSTLAACGGSAADDEPAAPEHWDCPVPPDVATVCLPPAGSAASGVSP